MHRRNILSAALAATGALFAAGSRVARAETQTRDAACGNTMRGQNVTLKDLLPGFTVAERGGVVLLAELQAQGYVYLRP